MAVAHVNRLNNSTDDASGSSGQIEFDQDGGPGPSGPGPSGLGLGGAGPSGTGVSGAGPSGTGASGTGPSGTDPAGTGVTGGATGSVSNNTVSRPGSGLVFNNTFDGTVTQAYKNCVIAAEQALEAVCTNADTINISFNAQAKGTNGTFLATNSWQFTVNVTLSQLENALASHERTPVGTSALNSLSGLSDPTGGAGFTLPYAYAVMLGLASPTSSIEDTVTLNTSYNWSFSQDVVNTLEHEISEGALGRVAGLGDQNSQWDTMDLFRFTSSGVRDFTDGRDNATTFFSFDNGNTLSSLAFNNQFSGGTKQNGGDPGDFTGQDVFGTGSPGETNLPSLTDVQVLHALGWNAPTVASDFTGLGTSDILWNNSSNGVVLLWAMSGTQVIGQAVIGGGGPWSLAGTGDFNGDGISDILWKNSNTGGVLMWEMAGSQVIGQATIGGGGGWSVVGTGDFNGNGTSDILWQNSNTGAVLMWEMNGTQVVNSAQIGGGGGWSIAGTGDFNGDGKTDILWQNSNNGAVLMWEMNGTQIVGSAQIGGGAPWKVVGTGDFNGDGYSDILWENTSSGGILMWEMNGTQVIGQAMVGGGGGWSVVGTGDYMGDGRSDILWQNSNNGAVLMGEWNGTQEIYTNTIGGGVPWSPFNNAPDGSGGSGAGVGSGASNMGAFNASVMQSASLMIQGMAGFGGRAAGMDGIFSGPQIGQPPALGGPPPTEGLFTGAQGDASTLRAGTHA